MKNYTWRSQLQNWKLFFKKPLWGKINCAVFSIIEEYFERTIYLFTILAMQIESI